MAIPTTTTTHELAHENNSMPKINTTELALSGSMELRTGGAYLREVSKVDGKSSLSVRAPYSDLVAATTPTVGLASELKEQYTLQADDSFDWTGTEKIVYFPARSMGAIVQKYYAKCGSVLATQPVNMKVYRGSSAGDIVPANLRYEADLPASLWTGNGNEFYFAIGDYAVDQFANVDSIDYLVGEQSIIVFSSSATFSAKFNAAQTIPFLKSDEHQIDDQELLTKYTTRTPHTSVRVDVSGGSVAFPLSIGKNYIKGNILNPLNTEDFTHGSDATSDYYIYTGECDCLFDGLLNFSMTSNTINTTISPGIEIERAAGGTEEQQGAIREFDGANPGNVTFITTDTLCNGDLIRLWFESDKEALTATLDYLFKVVRKVD